MNYFMLKLSLCNIHITNIQHASIKNDNLELIKILSAITKNQKFLKHDNTPKKQLLTRLARLLPNTELSKNIVEDIL